jgi:hypothetical protein
MLGTGQAEPFYRCAQVLTLLAGITCLNGSARQVVIGLGHVAFKGEGPIFTAPQSPHQETDQRQTHYV